MSRIVAHSPNGPASGTMRRLFLSDFRGESAFSSAALKTLSSAGDCHAPARPLRYPRDAGHRDLTRIGRDMYKAMERYATETSER